MSSSTGECDFLHVTGVDKRNPDWRKKFMQNIDLKKEKYHGTIDA
jgi:hypothetical protein